MAATPNQTGWRCVSIYKNAILRPRNAVGQPPADSFPFEDDTIPPDMNDPRQNFRWLLVDQLQSRPPSSNRIHKSNSFPYMNQGPVYAKKAS